MKCYVINLDRQPERWQDFLAHDPEDGNYTRLSAVDRLDLEALKDKNTLLNCDIVHNEMGHEPTWGEIACTLSHTKVWRLIAEDESLADDEFALVAEDDLFFADNAANLMIGLREYLRKNESKLNLVRLHHLHNPKGVIHEGVETLSLEGPDTIKPIDNGSSLYFIRKSKAKQLVAWLKTNKPFWLADWFNAFTDASEIRATSYNFCHIDGQFGSDLEAERSMLRGYVGEFCDGQQ
ncbi:MAG: glycosyltransferase family 25 protein [Veillonella sp.]|nr:glycosyltransferase family 25 protein [Veillonella sp.]